MEAVIREFASAAELVTLEDDLVAEARRILGERVQADGYVPPWRTFFGEPWTPALPSKATLPKGVISELPPVVEHDLAELPGDEYRSAIIPAHMITIRH